MRSSKLCSILLQALRKWGPQYPSLKQAITRQLKILQLGFNGILAVILRVICQLKHEYLGYTRLKALMKKNSKENTQLENEVFPIFRTVKLFFFRGFNGNTESHYNTSYSKQIVKRLYRTTSFQPKGGQTHRHRTRTTRAHQF